MKRLFTFALLTAALLLPDAVFAHGVEIYDETGQAGARTLRFMYSTGESMLFASVKVYPPSAPDASVQETMTDRDGYFSFVPFENGPWRLTVEDGMGHRGEITLTVGGAGSGDDPGNAAVSNAAPGGSGGAHRALRVMFGLSLILNIFAACRFILGRGLKARRPGGEPREPQKGGEHAY
jgi:nickel transport protein